MVKLVDSIELRFTSQPHYSHGGIDTMELIHAKFNTEQYVGLALGDVLRYVTRYFDKRNGDDIEKALTMLAWCAQRLRDEEAAKA